MFSRPPRPNLSRALGPLRSHISATSACKGETKAPLTTKSASVCNLALPDSFGEKAILCRCFLFRTFLSPLDMWHRKKQAREGGGGGGGATGCFMQTTPRSVLAVSHRSFSISAKTHTHTHTHKLGLHCLLCATSLTCCQLSGKQKRVWPALKREERYF